MAIIVERERFIFQSMEDFLAYLRAQQESGDALPEVSRVVATPVVTGSIGTKRAVPTNRVVASTETEGERGKDWETSALRRLWQMIPPQTRRIVGEIARQPLGYSKDDLRKTLGLEFKDIMGPLSGLRTRTNRAFKGYPPIVQVDYAQYQYTIGDPHDEARSEQLAGLILNLIERES